MDTKFTVSDGKKSREKSCHVIDVQAIGEEIKTNIKDQDKYSSISS